MCLKTFLALCATLGLTAGCSMNSAIELLDPYRIDVRQGNYVSQEMIAQLKKGMTRDQVRYVLGTPLLVDTFRTDRWDYVYLLVPGKGEPHKRAISVYFENDLLARIEGDVAPAGTGGEPVVTAPAPNRVIEVPRPEAK
ncbi:MAG TPA: outer membrane protein assembly factor BamE [Rhodocyclaceae bacterium]|nr:outer membrane protein assembly factor BamE [Rhodocyclaceae bacterium]